MLVRDSPLDSARHVPRHEVFNLGYCDSVEITQNRMLQAACRDSELQRLLPILVSVQPVDQRRRETVAAADPVDVGSRTAQPDDTYGVRFIAAPGR